MKKPIYTMVEGYFEREVQGRYLFKDMQGARVFLEGDPQLKYKMGYVTPGQRVKVECTGAEVIASGEFQGRMVRQISVFVDKDAA